MNICTIIAKNYLAHARVLARSCAEQHPDGRCWVLVIDEAEGFIDSEAEPFELVTPAEAGIENFAEMAAMYTVLELSTAVKPALLRHLLRADPGVPLAYLDPDIRAYAPLDELAGIIEEHGLVLIPHVTEPMPRDGKKPSETDILIAGVYNLGFIGLSDRPETQELLDYWAERLAIDCVVDPARGFFVDQRWIDFVPGLVSDFHILRDPGYDLAYWNLPTRTLERREDGYRVDGRPLRFYHFSGYDPDEPQRLSKHQDRIVLAEHEALAGLCAGYAGELEAAGYREVKGWPYSLARLSDGTQLDHIMRKLYRDAVQSGEPPGDIFTAEGAERFLRWLGEPAERGAAHGINRYALELWRSLDDVQRAYPDLDGDGGPGFAGWMHVFARPDIPIPRRLMPPNPQAGAEAPRGVNVAGYLRAELGVGEAARQVIGALRTQDIPVRPIELLAPASRQGHAFAAPGGTDNPFPVNLVCVNADMVGAFADDVGAGFFADRHSIGLWFWEVGEFPDRWDGAFGVLDEVWVASSHVADAVASRSPVPVVKVPLPVEVAPPPARSRAELGLPEGFLFLFVFDFNSVFARKNPIGAITAFARAFPPGSGAALAIKSINHERFEAEHERLRAAAASHPDVRLLDAYATPEDKDAMIHACDCYVSLHRSEGFGLTLAEAMALGRPVIATGYSGNLEFTTPANAYLVEHRLVPVGPGHPPYPAGAVWADPDTDHAAALMRQVFENPEEARDRGARGAADIRAAHSAEAAGRAMAARLDLVAGRLGGAHAWLPGAPAARTWSAGDVAQRVRRGPRADAPSRFGGAGRALRRAALRAMRPLSAYQQSVNYQVAGALEDLERATNTLAGLEARVAGVERHHDTLFDRVAGDPDRIDELARQADELRAEVARLGRVLRSVGMGPADPTDALPLDEFPTAPERPWTEEYVQRHRQFVTRALDDPALLTVFDREGELPRGYGVGFDERVIEFPWTLTRPLTGRVLDAGSTLNHAHILTRVRPRVEELHIVTLAPEEQSFPFLDVSYVYADLRELPVRDAYYDRVVCISTLEHVGMDNSHFGAPTQREADPDAQMERAVAELRRVLKPGGRLFVTVPYGEEEDLGWQKVFSPERVERLEAAFAPAEARRSFFRYRASGWERSSAEAAAAERYRDHLSDPEPAADRAVAARAIACLELVRP